MDTNKELKLLNEIRDLREMLVLERKARKVQQDKYNGLKDYVVSVNALLTRSVEGNPLPVDVQMKTDLGIYRKN